jgi:hypothetical protein
MVKDLVNHEYLYFDTSLLIKITPHTWPVQIWAICIDPKDNIWLMTGHHEWFELEETDRNYQEVLATLFQRMQSIYKTYKTAV